MSKTILVTGAAGFIGSHLVEHLVEAGDRVIGVDNFNDYYDTEIKVSNCSKFFDVEQIKGLAADVVSPYKNFQTWTTDAELDFADASSCLEAENYKLYGADLCDYKALRKIFEANDISHVVHIAALAGVRPSTQKPILYKMNNGESTVNLLELSREFGIKKFVFASSSSVYGSRSKVPFSEDEDVSKPISPYAATKVAGEAMVHAYHHLYKIPSICLRFFTVYGPRQRPDLAIHKFTRLISEGEEIQVYGDGSYKRDFTYIDDIIDGVLKAIDHDCAFEIFNLGESRTTDVNTLIRLLEERLGVQAKANYVDPIPGDVPITYADISKSKSVLGYNPTTDLEEGLDKFVEWYKAGIKVSAS